MISIGIIIASVREGRKGETFARWLQEHFAGHAEVDARLIDLRDWPFTPYQSKAMPLMAEKAFAPESLEQRWADEVGARDGFVVVTPEYNHGYPGQLKHALDHVYSAWNHKPVAFLTYGGLSGGARVAVQLREVTAELRMVPVRDEVNLRLLDLAVDERGFPSGELFNQRAVNLINELLWWARACQAARPRSR